MANALDGIFPDTLLLDFIGQENLLPCSSTRKEWFRITRELVASTIANMDLPPNELAEVVEVFFGAGLL